MEVRHSVFEPDQPSEYVYFPLSGVISIHTKMREGVAVEIATVGREGMVGLEVFLGGDRRPLPPFARYAGRAARIDADGFRQSGAGQCAAYRPSVALHAGGADASFPVGGMQPRHSVEERCARWLLMTHDRVRAIGSILPRSSWPKCSACVARPCRRGQHSAASRFIRYSRGRVEVVDRAGLESAACECYGVIEREYDRLIGAAYENILPSERGGFPSRQSRQQDRERQHRQAS